MNETFTVDLYDLVDGDTAYGNAEGREVYQKLVAKLDEYHRASIVGISLERINRTDASFPRESVVSLAKAMSGEKGFYIEKFGSKDLMDNWDYAAKAKGISLIAFVEDSYVLLGESLSAGLKSLLDMIMKAGHVTTAAVAEAFDLSVQNASAKLKKLSSLGLVLGAKRAAETGGVEYVYSAIRKI